MATKVNNKGCSCGMEVFVIVFTVLLIALKQFGVIDWDLVWILSPMWIAAIFVGFTFLMFKLFLQKYVKKAKEERELLEKVKGTDNPE